MKKILILDFGSQTTQLIARRIRDMGVYTEIIPGDTELTCSVTADVKGIILSGSPESVNGAGAAPDKNIYDCVRSDEGASAGCAMPLLGICYGLQRMTHDLGGRVESLPHVEYGRIAVNLSVNNEQLKENTESTARVSEFTYKFLKGFRSSFTAWMSHGDTLTRLAPHFKEYGKSATGYPAVVAHNEKPWFGLQFHPEVTHCEDGDNILGAFVFNVCGCEKNWSMERYIEELNQSLKERVGDNPVLLLISGGVDSTVAGAALLKSLKPEQVHLMYFDTGLMRKNETAAVRANLEKLGAKNLHIIMCEEEFLSALKGKTDPEEKRGTIGDLFITIQEREVAKIRLPDSYLLAQGTLYTDLIESGKGVGKKAHVIKSHHNVASPLVDAKRKAGKIIEPLDRLYKDEVRRLGRFLGIDEEIIRRHPFPGPGLATRIPGEVTKEKCDILREADAIFIEELKNRLSKINTGVSLYDDIWQAFAILLPIRSTGVAGDERKYGRVLALRAITSSDGMTADVYPFETRDLLEISTRITNSVKEIGRVTYDISSKPPATIEWE
ncbi:MAG: glutamine-hydrolyzing GMP synthase [Treponema sp.]|jgi:GMP synthase (glutamine-hydrolysing)|nr:glutamine-hydrolyzing GMP synthase [Treponema sp.]